MSSGSPAYPGSCSKDLRVIRRASSWTLGSQRRARTLAPSVPTGFHSAYLLMAGLVAAAGVLAVCFLRPEKDAARLDVAQTAPMGLAVH